MVKKNIELDKRNSALVKLRDWCHHSNDNDYMEVTEWSNGEGYDVCLGKESKSGVWSETMFQLTYGEMIALKKMVNEINKIYKK